MSLKVCKLISGVNEARYLFQHGSSECNCGLNENVCNSLQKSNHAACWCKCKELNDWSSCINYYIWNPSMCDCECNKACKIDEYLDIKNCSRKKQLLYKLALMREDEILNTTATSLNDTIAICENNGLTHTISLVIISKSSLFQLVAITIIKDTGKKRMQSIILI